MIRTCVPSPDAPRPPDGDPPSGQLILFPGGAAGDGGAPRVDGKNLRMAQRLDVLAARAAREAAAARRSGDHVTARQAAERARDARRAAALLRAGPAGVGRILAS